MGCVFCLIKEKKQKVSYNGFPEIELSQTKHSFAVLAVDQIQEATDRLLIVSNKHYELLDFVPMEELDDLMKHVQKYVKFFRSEKKDVKIIQNNGKGSGQVVPHVHFHLLAFDPDNKNSYVFTKKELSMSEFLKKGESLKNRYSKFLNTV